MTGIKHTKILSYLLFSILVSVSLQVAYCQDVHLLIPYEIIDVTRDTLAVNILKEDIFVDTGRVGLAFGEFLDSGEIHTTLLNYLRENLPERIRTKTTFSKAFSSNISLDTGKDKLFHIESRKGDAGMLRLREPNEHVNLPTGKIKAHYILFIDRIRFDPHTSDLNENEDNSKESSKLLKMRGDTSLYLKFQFFLWDNKEGKTLCYGTETREIKHGIHFNQGDFFMALSESSDEIFSTTPFSFLQIRVK